MGFLESAGRSGAIGQFGQTMFDSALRYKQMENQNAEIAMRAERQQAEMAMIAERQKAEKEAAEDAKTPIYIDEAMGKAEKQGAPNKGKFFNDMLEQSGLLRTGTLPDGTMKKYYLRGDKDQVLKLYQSSDEYQKASAQADYMDIVQVEVPGLEEQKAKAKTAVEADAIDQKIVAANKRADLIKRLLHGGGQSETYTLPPGAQRRGHNGELIAENPNRNQA